jgi:hypothetical protein
MAVAGYAILMQLGKGKRAWQYVWIIPLVYALVGGIEALLAGSLVGLMLVLLNQYRATPFTDNGHFLDSAQCTMLDISECQPGSRSYGH